MRRLVSAAITTAVFSTTVWAFGADLPDIVRLKNGGMVRGTIIELVPNDHVSIQLPNGEERKFAMTEVDYAGPQETKPAPPGAGDAPGTAAPPPGVPPGTPPALPGQPQPGGASGATDPRVLARVETTLSPVRFVGKTPGLTFAVRTGTAVAGYISAEGFQQVCTAPCTAQLANGSHKFAISRPDGKEAVSEMPVTIQGPSTVHGEYRSRSGLRTGGVLLVVLGGGLITAAPFIACDSGSAASCRRLDMGKLAALTVLGGLGVVVGVVMITKHDKAVITVEPGVTARSPTWSNVVADRSGVGMTPMGLTTTLEF
jgi:hypothetical protein